MKKVLVITIAMIASVMIGSAGAATITPQVNVAGSIAGKCSIVTSPGDITFTIDPSLAGPINATVGTQPVIKCSKNHPYTVACTSANTFHLVWGTNSIPYTFTCPANGSGNGFGAAGGVTMAIGGQVVATDYADAPVGGP
ncbi:MAG TPA: hypothetical protein VF905_10130, partial [Nitrospirota bacterium]